MTTTTVLRTPLEAPVLTSVNPWTWQDAMGFSQATLIEGSPRRTLQAAGQCSISPDGVPLYAGDLAAQTALAMDNVETVLAAAGFTLADVTRYDVYTTDLPSYFAQGHVELVSRFAAAGRIPAGGIACEVKALAMPPLMVEIVVTAVQ